MSGVTLRGAEFMAARRFPLQPPTRPPNRIARQQSERAEHCWLYASLKRHTVSCTGTNSQAVANFSPVRTYCGAFLLARRSDQTFNLCRLRR